MPSTPGFIELKRNKIIEQFFGSEHKFVLIF
jgi:hypothetical protein